MDSTTALAVIMISTVCRTIGRMVVAVMESLLVLAIWTAILVSGVVLLGCEMARTTRRLVARPHFQIH